MANDRHGTDPAQVLAHRAAKAADDGVLLGGDNAAGLLRRLEDKLFYSGFLVIFKPLVGNLYLREINI